MQPRGSRRAAQVVLWGGRPAIDYQFGSSADMARARLAVHAYRISSAMIAIGTALAPTVEQISRATRSFADALAAQTSPKR